MNLPNKPLTFVVPFAVFLIGLCLSVVAGIELRNEILDEAKSEFQRRVERVHTEVLRRFQVPVYGLNGAKGMLAASEKITRSTFRAYVQARDLPKEFPGLRGFGFIERVPRTALDSFIDAARNDGAPEFALRQLGKSEQHPDYLIIKYIDPATHNAGAVGLDIGSEATRRMGAERAIDSGEPTMTGAITLVQDDRKTPGVLILVPVFLNGTSPGNIPERRAALRGLMYSPIVIAELLHNIGDVGPDSIDFEIIDRSTISDTSTTLYDFDGHTESLSDTQHAAEGRRFFATLPLKVLGRDLILQVSSSSGFDDAISFTQAWLVFLTLSIINTLFSLLLFQQMSGKRRAERLAKEMTAKLEMEEARARDFSRSASDWFWETDEEQRFIFFSENFEQAYGFDPERLLGKSIRKVFERISRMGDVSSPDGLEIPLAQLDTRQPFKNFEYQTVLDSGECRWISISGVPYFSAEGVFLGYRGTGTIVTDRKKAEAEIRTRENRIRAIIETTVDGIIVIDAEGIVQSMNPAATKLFGYSEDEVLGRNVSMLMPEPYATEHDSYLFKYLSTGQKKVIGIGREVSGKRKDGSIFAMELAVSEMEANGARMFTGIVRDITDRKNAEASLLAAKQAADAANSAKSSFLAAMSHEIRTPMNGILGMLKLLLRTGLTPRQLDYASKAEGATQALLAIINDILDFSKVEAGKLELSLESMLLDEVMRDLAAILSSNVGSKNIEIVFDLAKDVPPTLIGDPLRLRQVLLNLAGNAVKFTEEGEIVISIRLVQHYADAVEVEFSVRDTGIGIAADKVDDIFGAFSQAETSTTRRFGGTGLGLAISHRLVTMMGGTLSVESELGKGSRFFFTIRFAIADALGTEPAKSHGISVPLGAQRSYLTPPGTALRVLAVEDNALARQVLQSMAESMGWQMQCVVSGEAALEHVQGPKAPNYDLVLIDSRLPGIDGWETALTLRQQESIATLPIVMMGPATSFDPQREILVGKPDLVDAYLVKPITASTLYETVAEAIMTREGGFATQQADQISKNLQGLRLLVVDDNRLNQQIAKELLEGCGAEVSIASNGYDGVAQALAVTPPFDVILMDVQMPDMDGLEATRRLREDTRMLGVPIIAMTANAMKSDQEACLAAGMVDHVAKPIDLDTLIATILRHVSASSVGTVSSLPKSTTIAAKAEPPAVTPEMIIDVDAAIQRIDGNRELYELLVEIYRADAPEALAQLQQHISRSEFSKAKLSAHTLKGLSATVGATVFAKLAGEMENALDCMPEDAASKALAEAVLTLSKQFRVTLNALPQKQTSTCGPESSPVRLATNEDRIALLRDLGELEDCLKNRDMRSTRLVSPLRQKVENASGEQSVRILLDDLDAALRRLDFVQALELCSSLQARLLKE